MQERVGHGAVELTMHLWGRLWTNPFALPTSCGWKNKWISRPIKHAGDWFGTKGDQVVMPELRIAGYIGAWLYLVQIARAAHPEALLSAMFIMFVGIAMAAFSIEMLIAPKKELTRQEQYEGDMWELFGMDVRDRGLTERKGTRLESGGLGENLAGVQSPRPLPYK